MKKRNVIIVSILIILVIILGSCIYPFTYGKKGSLSVKVTFDNNIISVNESLNVVIIIKNIGDTKIRLLDTTWTLDIIVEDVNGTQLDYIGEEYKLRRPFGFDLKTIKPGQEISVDYNVNSYWSIKNGSKNIIYAILSDNDDDHFLLLPRWTGEIRSDPVSFEVI